MTFDEGLVPVEPDWNLVQLDEALEALARKDERKSRVVELRFFGGLGSEEVAQILDVTPQTVRRDWRLAKRTEPPVRLPRQWPRHVKAGVRYPSELCGRVRL